jgi:hypothetical protein
MTMTSLPAFAEAGQRELSPFIGMCANLGEAAIAAIGLRPGTYGFGSKHVRKRDQPSFYFGVTGHTRKLTALLGFFA